MIKRVLTLLLQVLLSPIVFPFLLMEYILWTAMKREHDLDAAFDQWMSLTHGPHRHEPGRHEHYDRKLH